MKKSFLFICFFLFMSTVFCQQSLPCKKGIYLSFKQIKENSPAIEDSFEIKERTKGNIALVGGGKYGLELLAGSKSDYRKLKKELVGISDGANFYISDRFAGGGWQGLSVCLLSGPYIIAYTQGSAGQYTGGGIIPSFIKVENGYLINLQTATSTAITNKVLKQMLEPYPEIAKKYSVTAGLTLSAVQIITDINAALNAK